MVMSTNNAGKVGAPTASQKRMKNVNSSSSGLNNQTNNTASGKNVRSMSLSKRLAMGAGSNNLQHAGNKTIDMSNMHNFQTVEVGGQPQIDLNNTAVVHFNTIMA